MGFAIDWVKAGAVIFTGISVVFAVLVLLWFLVFLIGKLMPSKTVPKSNGANAAPQQASVAAQKQQPVLAVQDGISDEVIAVISAAVAAMSVSGTMVLRSIKRAKAARSAWGMAGLEQNTQQF